MSFNVFDIIESRCQWVIDIDDNDLPICFLFIEKSHDSQNLHLLDLAWGSHQLTYFAHIEWVVVSFGLSFGMDNIGIFPSLNQVVSLILGSCLSYVPEGTRRSSIDILYEESNCGRNEAFPS